ASYDPNAGRAGLAQLVEQRFCKPKVAGSNPASGTARPSIESADHALQRTKPVCEVGAELGEGPVWDPRDRALWFVDIKNRKVHRYDPATGEYRTWQSPEPVGFLFPARSGGFLAGLESGLFTFDPEGGTFDRIITIEADKPHNRLNDGAVDPDGRLWFGT